MSELFGALGQVLARDLSQIEDLPDFVTPPPGVYKLLVEQPKQETINDKTAIVVSYVVVEVVALNDEKDLEFAPKAGDKFTEAFWFNDSEKIEQTLSVLKAKYGNLGEPLGTTNLLEIMEKMGGNVVQAIVTNRTDKKDKTKVYAGTRDIFMDGTQPADYGTEEYTKRKRAGRNATVEEAKEAAVVAG